MKKQLLQKMLSVTLAGVMAFGLTACGGSSGGESAPAATETTGGGVQQTKQHPGKQPAVKKPARRPTQA